MGVWAPRPASSSVACAAHMAAMRMPSAITVPRSPLHPPSPPKRSTGQMHGGGMALACAVPGSLQANSWVAYANLNDADAVLGRCS